MFNHVAIVGAAGAVGREILRILQQRQFPFETLTLTAARRSVGTRIESAGTTHTVQPTSPETLRGADLAFLAAAADLSRALAPELARSRILVIDNSSAFRSDPAVPLVVPEINPADLTGHHHIIANPNCSTIIMLLAVAPLHRRFRVRRIIVSTYQSASGAGARAMQELEHQTRAVLAGHPVEPEVFPHPIAFNLFCHDSPVQPDGYNDEERKMIDETRRILADPEIAVSATCVRVPVLRAHSESIHLEFEKELTESDAREVLSQSPGLCLVDDRQAGRFPMPCDATNTDDVLVGRIRADASRSDNRGIALFLCGDQLRKGAALNAVQIAEHLDR